MLLLQDVFFFFLAAEPVLTATEGMIVVYVVLHFYLIPFGISYTLDL
jgi:hypothetical protein